MYWLVDVLALLFVVGLTLYGYKAGFFRSTVNVLLTLVCFAGAIAGAYFTIVYVFAPWGWLEELTLVFANLLGSSKVAGGQAVVEQTAYILGFALLMLILSIVYGLVLHMIRRLIGKLFKAINSLAFFGFFDKLIGTVLNFAISAGIVLCILAFFNVFTQNGILFTYANEVIRASEVLSLVADINPLNEVFASFGIAETLEQLFMGML